MKKGNLQLTTFDRLVLESYNKMLDGLAEYLGNGYELVLHSLENYEHSAIKVINGFHTGRCVGAPITDRALKILEELKKNPLSTSGVTYYSTNAGGEQLKSTTIPIQGENKRIIGLLCINFYLNTSVTDFFQNFLSGTCQTSDSAPVAELQENFAQSSSELLEHTIHQVRTEVLMDSSVTSSCKNKDIIKRLYQQGIFNLKDAVIIVARELNISKNTVYLHLRNIEKE